MSKNILTSWTVWFGVLQILTSVVGYFGHIMSVQEAGSMAITGFGTIGLRIKTTQPVQFLPSQPVQDDSISSNIS